MTTHTEVIEKIDESIKVQAPKMYKVILHNDDTTTFDFVIAILTTIFHRNIQDAYDITIGIHETGQGIAGSPFTREIAEEKTMEVISFSRANGFPLTATFEEL
jgi:ATP-dependent Clp protease adaptor protein ClpS